MRHLLRECARFVAYSLGNSRGDDILVVSIGAARRCGATTLCTLSRRNIIRANVYRLSDGLRRMGRPVIDRLSGNAPTICVSTIGKLNTIARILVRGHNALSGPLFSPRAHRGAQALHSSDCPIASVGKSRVLRVPIRRGVPTITDASITRGLCLAG